MRRTLTCALSTVTSPNVSHEKAALYAVLYLWFLHDLDEIHVVLHWVDDN